MVLAVGSGLVAATFSALLVHSRRTAFFRHFLANILLFNLIVLVGLVFRFVELQVRDAGGSVWLPILLAIMAVLKLAWLYAFLSMIFVLPGEEVIVECRAAAAEVKLSRR